MARLSTIDKLDPEVRTVISDLRDEGRTIDEILSKLRELSVDVSRTALGRYTKEIDELNEMLRQSGAISEAVYGRLENESLGKTARVNFAALQAIMLRVLSGETKFTPQEVMFMASAMQKLSSAAKVDLDRELKLREEAAKKAKAEAAQQLDQAAAEASAAGEKGLSAARIAQLRRDFLGVRPAA